MRFHKFKTIVFIFLLMSWSLIDTSIIFSQKFVSQTRNSGLGPLNGTNGVALADYDRDGDIDIYFVIKESNTSLSSKTWNRLMQNRGNGIFADATAKAGLFGQDKNEKANPSGMGSKMGAAWGDYDNDGWPDLYLTHFGPNQLFHNNGDGTFSDVTAQAGISTSQNQMSSSALWFDYDKDGDLDLYVSIQAEFFEQTENKKNRLFENRGDGTFADVSEVSGVADNGKTWTTVALDANDDGFLDLYLANDFGFNKFYLNNGNKTFSENTTQYGLEDKYHGMGLAITDCDGNGFLDLYLTNIAEISYAPEINPLFLNTGQNLFTNTSVDAGVSLAGWGWGTEFFDLENDGDEDLFVVTGNFDSNYENVLFENLSEQGGFEYKNIAQAAGVADLAPGRSLAIFDFNNDGAQDILISNYANHPELYQNPNIENNWLKVALEGTTSNRDGFGAIVEILVDGKPFKKYHHGAQFLAQNILPLHFGLNKAETVDKITVKWPSGHEDEIQSVRANQTIKVIEGQGLVSSVSANRFHKTLQPSSFKLLGNYPNPFNGITQLSFFIESSGNVKLEILNSIGQKIKTIERYFNKGKNSLSWNATDNNRRTVSAGIYFYKLIDVNARHTFSGKMVYIK